MAKRKMRRAPVGPGRGVVPPEPSKAAPSRPSAPAPSAPAPQDPIELAKQLVREREQRGAITPETAARQTAEIGGAPATISGLKEDPVTKFLREPIPAIEKFRTGGEQSEQQSYHQVLLG